ncbi:MAG: EthD family reductase [Phycisphaerae bacterium]|nr:EthD family reductase [Phycisphaerae bacterium]NUQ46305.1 EthD family reductase [Phycisphaerae bacterium]
MHKVIALYRKPEDPAAFDKHYFEIHTPLAMKMPGLRRMEVARLTTTQTGAEAPYYLVAEMYFDSAETARAAFASPEGKAAGKDVMSFAGKLITMMHADILE